MKIKKQKGYTLFEAVVVIAAVIVLSGLITAGYVVLHFLSKVW